MTKAIVMFTNEAHHPRAVTYREGFRHCVLFVWTADGWYSREFIPGAGEIISPRVAERDDDLFTMLGGGDTRIDRDLVRRRSNIVETEIRYKYQWRWAWYRKLPTSYVKHYLGLNAPAVKRPYHLFKHLEPTEEKPKKTSKIALVASPFVPAK